VIVVWILLLVLLHVLVLAGLLAIVLGLGGNFILLGLSLVTAWVGGFHYLTLWVWLVLLGLAVLGEVVESLLGVAAARGFGASRWGMLGAFVGGIAGAAIGTAWLPVIGSLIGAFAGAFAGAFVAEMLAGRSASESTRAGVGAFLGRMGATVFKIAVGGVIVFFTMKAAYAAFGAVS